MVEQHIKGSIISTSPRSPDNLRSRTESSPFVTCRKCRMIEVCEESSIDLEKHAPS
jgi:hypothetical protein